MADTHITSPAIDQVRVEHGNTLASALQTIWNALITGLSAGKTNALSPSMLTLPNLTKGSVLFVGDGGVVSEDNTYFNWAETGSSTSILSVSKASLLAGSSLVTYPQVGGTIFNVAADTNNSGTSETTLHTYTLKANSIDVNLQKVAARYAGIFVGDATSTQRIRIYFGTSGSETLIFDSGALGIGITTAHWDIDMWLIRESSSVVRCTTALVSSFATLAGDSQYTRVTGLTLSNDNVLKITGTAAGATGASNQITIKQACGEWKPEAR